MTEQLSATDAYLEEFDATIVEARDGGVHLANTRAIGRIRIAKTENKDQSNKRLEIAPE